MATYWNENTEWNHHWPWHHEATTDFAYKLTPEELMVIEEVRFKSLINSVVAELKGER